MKVITDEHFHLPKPEPYQRFGSGDGERKTLLTRQIASEPLPASVLFGLGFGVVTAHVIDLLPRSNDLAIFWQAQREDALLREGSRK